MLTNLKIDEVADKDDLLGIEDKPKTSIFSSKPSMRNRSTVFIIQTSNQFNQ